MCHFFDSSFVILFLVWSSSFVVLNAHLVASANIHLHQSTFGTSLIRHDASSNVSTIQKHSTMSRNATGSNGKTTPPPAGPNSTISQTSNVTTSTSPSLPSWSPSQTSFGGWHNSSSTKPSDVVSAVSLSSAISRSMWISSDLKSSSVASAHSHNVLPSTTLTANSAPIYGSLPITSSVLHLGTPSSRSPPYTGTGRMNTSSASIHRGYVTGSAVSHSNSWPMTSVSVSVNKTLTRVSSMIVGWNRTAPTTQSSLLTASTLTFASTKSYISSIASGSVTNGSIGRHLSSSSQRVSYSTTSLRTNSSSTSSTKSANNIISLRSSTSGSTKAETNFTKSNHLIGGMVYSASTSRNATSTPSGYRTTASAGTNLQPQSVVNKRLSTSSHTASSRASSLQSSLTSRLTTTSKPSVSMTPCSTLSKTQPATTSWTAGACTIT